MVIVADVLLAAALTPEGIALFEVDPLGGGVTRAAVTRHGHHPAGWPWSGWAGGGRPAHRGRRRPGNGSTSGQARAAARAPATALARARATLACIALSAEQVGAAQRALEADRRPYQRPRVQFGQAIGGFPGPPAPDGRPARPWWSRPRALVLCLRGTGPPKSTPTAGDAPDLGLRAAAAQGVLFGGPAEKSQAR